jgi:hypothetical protein
VRDGTVRVRAVVAERFCRIEQFVGKIIVDGENTRLGRVQRAKFRRVGGTVSCTLMPSSLSES